MASRGAPNVPTPADQKTIPYPIQRAKFVSEYGKVEYAVWLVQVGEYVRSCWHSEEEKLGRPLTEADETDEEIRKLWDEFSEENLRTQRERAIKALKTYRRRYIIPNFCTSAWFAFPGFIRAILRAMRDGILGALAVFLFSVAIITLLPSLAKWAGEQLAPIVEASRNPSQN